MMTSGKLWLFILGVLVCGCPQDKPSANATPEAAKDQAIEPQANLEARCFDGDPAACDELGH